MKTQYFLCPVCHKADELDWFELKRTTSMHFWLTQDADGTLSISHATHDDPTETNVVLHRACGGAFDSELWAVEW